MNNLFFKWGFAWCITVGIMPEDLKYETTCALGETAGSCNTIEDIVEFLHYTRSSDNPNFLQPNKETFPYDKFDRKLRTVIFIHGFQESGYGEAAQLIKHRLLAYKNYNVILVSWQKLSVTINYCRAMKSLPTVATYVVKLIMWLEAESLISINQLHIIGFSLGAHISGLVGANIFDQLGKKVGRITGLDPAGPLFELMKRKSNTLDPADADFVDIIHTDTAQFGIPWILGHVEFFPNDGKYQPGCAHTDIACSHSRAWQYFAESIRDRNKFGGAKCDGLDTPLEKCNPKKTNHMGFHVYKTKRGIYKLKTNSKSPFSKGIDGTF